MKYFGVGVNKNKLTRASKSKKSVNILYEEKKYD